MCLSVCPSVCLHVYLCVCVSAYTRAYMHVLTHTHIHTRGYAYIRIYIYVHTHMHMHNHTYMLGPKQTWLNSNIRSNERTFECSLRNLNFAINSMRKCALISKVEKWHPHFKKWLQMLPVQVIWVNLCP